MEVIEVHSLTARNTHIRPCSEGRMFLKGRTVFEAMADLDCHEWLFWYIAANSVVQGKGELAVLFACECAWLCAPNDPVIDRVSLCMQRGEQYHQVLERQEKDGFFSHLLTYGGNQYLVIKWLIRMAHSLSNDPNDFAETDYQTCFTHMSNHFGYALDCYGLSIAETKQMALEFFRVK